jgi:hypothetical protein
MVIVLGVALLLRKDRVGASVNPGVVGMVNEGLGRSIAGSGSLNPDSLCAEAASVRTAEADGIEAAFLSTSCGLLDPETVRFWKDATADCSNGVDTFGDSISSGIDDDLKSGSRALDWSSSVGDASLLIDR